MQPSTFTHDQRSPLTPRGGSDELNPKNPGIASALLLENVTPTIKAGTSGRSSIYLSTCRLTIRLHSYCLHTNLHILCKCSGYAFYWFLTKRSASCFLNSSFVNVSRELTGMTVIKVCTRSSDGRVMLLWTPRMLLWTGCPVVIKIWFHFVGSSYSFITTVNIVTVCFAKKITRQLGYLQA